MSRTQTFDGDGITVLEDPPDLTPRSKLGDRDIALGTLLRRFAHECNPFLPSDRPETG
jgi:hypothetical protein